MLQLKVDTATEAAMVNKAVMVNKADMVNKEVMANHKVAMVNQAVDMAIEVVNLMEVKMAETVSITSKEIHLREHQEAVITMIEQCLLVTLGSTHKRKKSATFSVRRDLTH